MILSNYKDSHKTTCLKGLIYYQNNTEYNSSLIKNEKLNEAFTKDIRVFYSVTCKSKDKLRNFIESNNINSGSSSILSGSKIMLKAKEKVAELFIHNYTPKKKSNNDLLQNENFIENQNQNNTKEFVEIKTEETQTNTEVKIKKKFLHINESLLKIKFDINNKEHNNDFNRYQNNTLKTNFSVAYLNSPKKSFIRETKKSNQSSANSSIDRVQIKKEYDNDGYNSTHNFSEIAKKQIISVSEGENIVKSVSSNFNYKSEYSQTSLRSDSNLLFERPKISLFSITNNENNKQNSNNKNKVELDQISRRIIHKKDLIKNKLKEKFPKTSLAYNKIFGINFIKKLKKNGIQRLNI